MEEKSKILPGNDVHLASKLTIVPSHFESTIEAQISLNAKNIKFTTKAQHVYLNSLQVVVVTSSMLAFCRLRWGAR